MIHCEGLVKIYKTSEVEVVALQGLNLTVEDGEMMAIIGNSGSGKSTLLNILGGWIVLLLEQRLWEIGICSR